MSRQTTKTPLPNKQGIQAEPLSPTRNRFDVLLRVEVGPQRARSDIYRGLLCEWSTHFRTVFNNRASPEFRGNVIRFPDQTPHIFEIVRSWLYSGLITVNIDGKDEPCEDFVTLVDLFLFGQKYSMPELRNGIINLLIRIYQKHGNFVLAKNIARVYKNTPADSPLRKLIVATYVLRPKANDDLYEANRSFYLACPEFLLDLTKALDKDRKKPSLWHIEDPCQYHEHAETEHKCPKPVPGEVAKASPDKVKTVKFQELSKTDAPPSKEKRVASGVTAAAKGSNDKSKAPQAEKDGRIATAPRKEKQSQLGTTTTTAPVATASTTNHASPLQVDPDAEKCTVS